MNQSTPLYPQIKITEKREQLYWSFTAETIVRIKNNFNGKHYLTEAIRAKRIGNIEMSKHEDCDIFLNRERSSSINQLTMDAHMLITVGEVNMDIKDVAGNCIFILDTDQKPEKERLLNLFKR